MHWYSEVRMNKSIITPSFTLYKPITIIPETTNCSSYFSCDFSISKEMIPFWSERPVTASSHLKRVAVSPSPSIHLINEYSLPPSSLSYPLNHAPLDTNSGKGNHGETSPNKQHPSAVASTSSRSNNNNNKQTRNVGERNDHNLRRSRANRYICFGYRTARKNTEIYCFSWKSHFPSLFRSFTKTTSIVFVWCDTGRKSQWFTLYCYDRSLVLPLPSLSFRGEISTAASSSHEIYWWRWVSLQISDEDPTASSCENELLGIKK